MDKGPWITIVGLGEDGLDGLSTASRSALDKADIVMGPPRHLSLLPNTDARRIEWPVPFAEGLSLLDAQRGQQVVVLASGDPFWFGAGQSIARHFAPEDWTCLPAPSTFSQAAARLGWPIESTHCLGLHARPMQHMRAQLSDGERFILLLRDGQAVQELGSYLTDIGFGDSKFWVMEALGGPRERITEHTARALAGTFAHPVCVAAQIAGEGLPLSCGKPDATFQTDGVMTKRPMRALTLSALAPRAGERLWDIGSGSGSIAVEWMLAHPSCRAIAIEGRPDRCALIARNAETFGLTPLHIVEGNAPDALANLPEPDAVFVGGGLGADLLAWLDEHLPRGTRIVANAVTLDSEALLTDWTARKGGDLMRIELSNAKPLGTKQAWSAAYPIVQWSGVL